jgi:hypothetical protein
MTGELNWANAKAKCELFGGNLASGRDQYHINLLKVLSAVADYTIFVIILSFLNIIV